LAERSDRDELLEKISAVTNRGMNGELNFTESLRERLAFIPASKKQVLDLADKLKSQVSDSFLRNKKFFSENSENIYFFSGGFKDFILPVLLDFGVREENIYANTFVYNHNDEVVGFDENNFLSMPGGKVKMLRALDLEGELIVVGDGYTDYEMREAGLAHQFIAFTENVQREKVIARADLVADNIEKVLAVWKS